MFPIHVAKIDPHHGLNLFGLGRGYELIADCKKSVSYDKKYTSYDKKYTRFHRLNLCPSGTCGIYRTGFSVTRTLWFKDSVVRVIGGKNSRGRFCPEICECENRQSAPEKIRLFLFWMHGINIFRVGTYVHSSDLDFQ